MRQNLREILAFLIPLLDSFFERVRWVSLRVTHILICAFVAEIMGLSFCEDDISVQPKKGHYRVDIAPELFLKRNGRGCDDNRLVHAFAVQQHRHKIAKGLSNAHASFNRKMLIVYEGVHNLKGHILLPFTHFQSMLRGFIPKEGADLLTHGVQLCFSALFPFLRCIESKIESIIHPHSSRNRNQGYLRFSSMLTFPFSSMVSVMCLMCFS